MSNLEYVEIYPNVDVYRNVLKDPQQMYDVMKKSEQTSEGKYFLNTWDQWAHFGTYTQKKHPHEIAQEVSEDEMFIKEEAFVYEVEDAYNKVIMDYVARH